MSNANELYCSKSNIHKKQHAVNVPRIKKYKMVIKINVMRVPCNNQSLLIMFQGNGSEVQYMKLLGHLQAVAYPGWGFRFTRF